MMGFCWPKLIVVLTGLAIAAVPPEPDATDFRSESEQAGAADKDPRRIEEILSRLEKRSEDVTDIRCRVRFVINDQINLSRQCKEGEILFRITDTNPQFLIRFDRTETDGILGKREWYLFDGRWLYQALERLQQVTKQEIARPGERIDLFDLETAPFPLPFGQRKQTILKHFDVRLEPAGSDGPPNTDHLVCTPKPDGVMHGKYDKLEFFVLRDLHLPIRIVVTKSDGYEVNTADFLDLSEKSINSGLTDRNFARPGEWRGFQEIVEELVPLEESRR